MYTHTHTQSTSESKEITGPFKPLVSVLQKSLLSQGWCSLLTLTLFPTWVKREQEPSIGFELREELI